MYPSALPNVEGVPFFRYVKGLKMVANYNPEINPYHKKEEKIFKSH